VNDPPRNERTAAEKWKERLELANLAADLIEKVGKGAGWFAAGLGAGGGAFLGLS